jgi:hypothetical protein
MPQPAKLTITDILTAGMPSPMTPIIDLTSLESPLPALNLVETPEAQATVIDPVKPLTSGSSNRSFGVHRKALHDLEIENNLLDSDEEEPSDKDEEGPHDRAQQIIAEYFDSNPNLVRAYSKADAKVECVVCMKSIAASARSVYDHTKTIQKSHTLLHRALATTITKLQEEFPKSAQTQWLNP